MQYWDADTPPVDISMVMQTWESAKYCDYILFNRTTAIHFLKKHLDSTWKRAFLMARSPMDESDFFRLCFLMLNGGLYADSDDRLISDIDELLNRSSGLTVTLERYGKVGSNIIIAPAKHPAIVWAAVSAKTSLLQRDNDSTWSKAGPGLLTRSIAKYIQRNHDAKTRPNLSIIQRYKFGEFIQFHTPLPYKRSKQHWNSQNMAGNLNKLCERFLEIDT